MVMGALLCSCSGQTPSANKGLQQCADSFSAYYFNCLYTDALRFATPDSRKWLEVAASNITAADIDLLHQQEHEANVNTEITNATDTTAQVVVSVSDYMVKDTIGVTGHMIHHTDTYVLMAVMTDGKWRIRMEGLPQSGKRSHD